MSHLLTLFQSELQNSAINIMTSVKPDVMLRYIACVRSGDIYRLTLFIRHIRISDTNFNVQMKCKKLHVSSLGILGAGR